MFFATVRMALPPRSRRPTTGGLSFFQVPLPLSFNPRFLGHLETHLVPFWPAGMYISSISTTPDRRSRSLLASTRSITLWAALMTCLYLRPSSFEILLMDLFLSSSLAMYSHSLTPILEYSKMVPVLSLKDLPQPRHMYF